MHMKKQKIFIAVVLAVVVSGGVGFYGGMKYQSGKAPAASLDQQARFVGSGTSFGGATCATRGIRTVGGGLTTGEVLAKDDKSLTIKLRDGGSKIIFFTPETPVTQTTSASREEVAVGKTVTVVGIANPDGSVTASSIQLSPEFLRGSVRQ